MKKIIINWFFILACITLNAQNIKPVLESSNEKLSLEKRTLDFDMEALSKVEARNFDAEYQPILNFKGTEFAKSSAQVVQRDKTGQASFIKAELNPTSRSLVKEHQLKIYLEQLSPILEIKKEDLDFSVLKEWTDDLNHKHYKMQQNWKGIPIYGAEIIIHEQNEIINALNGKYVSSNQLITDNELASLAFQDAESIVQDQIKNRYAPFSEEIKLLSDKLKQWKTELVFYQDEGALRLSYSIKVYPNFGEWMSYFVDANSGEIIKKYSNICKLHAHGRNGESTCNHHHDRTDANNPPPDGPAVATAIDLFGNSVEVNTYEVGSNFYMIDGSREMFNLNDGNMPNNPAGAIWVLDGFNNSLGEDFEFDHVISPNNNWNAPEAISAQFNGSKAFEYFTETHNRNSIDGDGGTMISFVNIADINGDSFGNAFWNGVAIFYGNGDSGLKPLARALDVAGHEMTHGVINQSANLEYLNESGAINESFADCFGAMIDREDWLIGEDVVRTSQYPSGAMRNISDPANGASPGDFFNGYQPSHVDDMYLGELDAGGVHINSGIPNKAFYLIATDLGKNKTEKIYYRALTNYLTKSSQFTDLRIAVVQAAEDLCGTSDVNVVKNAFAEVGIGDGPGGNYQNDANPNPGSDLILYTKPDFEGLYLVNGEGDLLADPLSDIEIRSRPSVTDDGSFIVFVGEDKKLYSIIIDWTEGTFSATQVNDQPVWRNVIISKDGSRLAALSDDATNEIMVFDFGKSEWNDFELYNPTYTQGVTTGDALYADVMEFDLTSNYILYDSYNEIQSSTADPIRYWDMGIIRIWDEDENDFDDGTILKPFPSLEDGISIGNPTFAKNSPYVIAFDIFSPDITQVLGANLETGEVGLIFDNTQLGFPNFSKDDDRIIFDIKQGNEEELGVLNLNTNKISASQPSTSPWFFQNNNPSRWGIWFGNGVRILSDIKNIEATDHEFIIYPNPATTQIQLEINEEIKYKEIIIHNVLGEIIAYDKVEYYSTKKSIDVSTLIPGTYFISLVTNDKQYNRSFIIAR